MRTRLKVLTLGLLVLIGGVAWWGVRRVTGSAALAVAVGAAMMAVPSIPLTWLLGVTFARFDLTTDSAGA